MLASAAAAAKLGSLQDTIEAKCRLSRYWPHAIRFCGPWPALCRYPHITSKTHGATGVWLTIDDHGFFQLHPGAHQLKLGNTKTCHASKRLTLHHERGASADALAAFGIWSYPNSKQQLQLRSTPSMQRMVRRVFHCPTSLQCIAPEKIQIARIS